MKSQFGTLLNHVPIGPFLYERFELQSHALGRHQKVGIFRNSKIQSPKEIRRTLYLLHGGNGDDTQHLDLGLLAQLNHHPDLQVVMPGIEGSFLAKAYSNAFFEELIPNFENGTGTSPESRLIAGISMGGQAALNAFFRRPEFFAGVGTHFATLIGFDPFNAAASEEYRVRSKVADGYFPILMSSFSAVFRDAVDFSVYDPLQLASHGEAKVFEGKRIYFDVGTQDEFGLHEGSDRLHELLKKRGIQHTYEKIAGGKHDVPFIHQQFPKLIRSLNLA